MDEGQGKKGSRLRIRLLRPASVDFRFLLTRKYPRKSALNFVGNHYQLSRTERHILYRSVFTRSEAGKRRAKTVRATKLSGQQLVVDGYNCFITLENAIRDKPLVLADDGFVRDIAMVFRRFRQSSMTKHAWAVMSQVLLRYRPRFVHVLLDAPYCGSGELASTVNKWMLEDGIDGKARTVKKTEKEIAAMEGIKATADSVIIDHSDAVFDLAGHIIRYILKRKLIKI